MVALPLLGSGRLDWPRFIKQARAAEGQALQYLRSVVTT
jgi:hypothetical protein